MRVTCKNPVATHEPSPMHGSVVIQRINAPGPLCYFYTTSIALRRPLLAMPSADWPLNHHPVALPPRYQISPTHSVLYLSVMVNTSDKYASMVRKVLLVEGRITRHGLLSTRLLSRHLEVLHDMVGVDTLRRCFGCHRLSRGRSSEVTFFAPPTYGPRQWQCLHSFVTL